MYSNISAADILLCVSLHLQIKCLEIEEWDFFDLSKPFAVYVKHNYGPQFSFWLMHSHQQPMVKD